MPRKGLVINYDYTGSAASGRSKRERGPSNMRLRVLRVSVVIPSSQDSVFVLLLRRLGSRVVLALRGKLAALEVRDQPQHDVRRDGVTFDAAGAGDVDADGAAVERDQRAAAHRWGQHRVVLDHRREVGVADAQGAAHLVHHFGAGGGANAADKLGLDVELLLAALDGEADLLAGHEPSDGVDQRLA